MTAGHNLSLGQSGAGGTLNGGARYGNQAGQHEIVTVTIAFEESGGGGGGGGGEPEGPNVEEPGQPAVGVVAREIPQYHPKQANSVARVLSQTTTRGHCVSHRPVHCSVGTLTPGATVTIRAHARVLVVQPLRSVLIVSSDTPETNTTNNTSIAFVTAFAPAPKLAVSIGPSSTVHIGQRVRYRVTVTGGGQAGAASVRLCTRVPATLIAVRSPGTSAYRGRRCVTAAHLAAGRTRGFTVSALASARGRLFPSATATATDLPRPAGASTRIRVLGPLVVCAARALRPPLARAAC